MLDQVFVNDIPNLKDRTRTEKIDYLQNRASPQSRKILRMDELAEKLRGL